MNDMSTCGKIFFVFLSIFFGCVFFLSGVIVSAAENADKDGVPDAGIQISPTKFIWALKNGEEKASVINVKNYSNVAQKVIVEAEDFYIGDDGSEPLFFIPDNEHPRKNQDILDWITLPKDFVLEPGESTDVEFRVNVPMGQPTNGYYGSIFFRTGVLDGKKTVDGASVMGINYRIGALIIMTVQGKEPMKIEGVLKDFYSSKKIFWSDPAELVVEAINVGNVHYPMYGKIKINKFDNKFHVIELKPQLIYPGMIKKYVEDMEFGMWDFGKYTANLSMWSYDKTVKLDKKIVFFIFPWKGLSTIAGGGILLFVARFLMRTYVHIGRKK